MVVGLARHPSNAGNMPKRRTAVKTATATSTTATIANITITKITIDNNNN